MGIGGTAWEKGVETDAGPLDLVEGREEGEALVEGVGIGKERDGFFEEKSGEVFREEAVGLVREVDEGFCGVVPAGVFKIDIAKCGIRLSKGVVEAEVGGREAALRGREDFAAGGIWDVFDSFAKLVPEREERAANEEHGLLMVLAGGLNLLKAVDAGGGGLEMCLDREACFGDGREVFGECSPSIHFRKELCGVEDVGFAYVLRWTA